MKDKARHIRRLGMSYILICIFVTPGYSIIFVSKDGDDTTGASWRAAFNTIGKALIVAHTGESVWVKEGVYPEGLRIDKEVQLYGGFKGDEILEEFPLENPRLHSTLVSGGTTNDIIRCRATLLLDGFTVSGEERISAHGIELGNCSATIRRCHIAENIYDEGTGAGLFIFNSHVHLDHCVIQNNSAGLVGGGIDSSNSTLRITNCIIQDNEARDQTSPWHVDSGAGGIVFSGTMTIENSIIANNKATNHSQLSGSGPGNLLFKNCTIYSSDIEFMRVDPKGGEPGMFVNCIFSGNPQVFPAGYPIDVLSSNSSQELDGPGNISEDPLFVDAEGGDFRLMPDSPCIDSGTDVGVYFDITGSTRPIDVKGIGQDGTGSEFDMGAYELQIPKADLNGDGKIDGRDLLEFQREWKTGALGK